MTKPSFKSERKALEVPFDRNLIHNPAVGLAHMARTAGGVAFSKVAGQTVMSIADALLGAQIQYDHDDYFCRSRQQKRLNRMFGEGLLTEEAESWSAIHDSVNNSLMRNNIQKYHNKILATIDNNIEKAKTADLELHLKLGEDTIGWSVATISTVLFGGLPSDETISRFLDAYLERVTNTSESDKTGLNLSPFKRLLKSLFNITTEVEKLLEAPVQEALLQDPTTNPNLLLDIKDELKRESRCPFKRHQYRDLVKTLFMAGIQTSAYTLDWALILLARNAQYWQQLSTAVRPRLGQSRPTLDDIDALEAVHNVIKEVMRLRPVIPTIQKAVVKPCELAGVEVDTGDTLNISIYGIHHSEDYWVDPDAFRPERFESELKAKSFTPFGLGQHTCIGQHLAIHVLTASLIRLVQQFDIVPDSSLSLEMESTFLLKPANNQMICLRPVAVARKGSDHRL